MKVHFVRCGIPEVVRSHGGPKFSSHIFASFGKVWGFKHEISSPYHSQPSGKAESAARGTKKILQKRLVRREELCFGLLEHQDTPSAGIGLSPSKDCSLDKHG